ncbi:MAG TPA: VlmB-like protein [Thermoanaerobaculia bacterium]|nr:VlmB-like protein [Thermoanaerobaculia bacterium]
MTTIPRETDFNEAPDLLEGALNLDLTAEQCDIEYWLHASAQGTLRNLVHGHRPDLKVPQYLLDPGPLRESVLEEYAFRTVVEEYGTRCVAYMVQSAPTRATLEFYVTQLFDEARHFSVFRHHLIELGIREEKMAAFLRERTRFGHDQVLGPLLKFALDDANGRNDFYVAVVMLTVIVEGVLAPSSEMSERKWKVLDPLAADVARTANIDEIRHLCVGSSIVRQHLREHPEERERLGGLMMQGMQLWKTIPIKDLIVQREVLFQQGMLSARDVLGDYELVPGRRLIDTTVEERLGIQMEWSTALQTKRLQYMGLA